MPRHEYEGFESRRDFEEYRELLLEGLPGLINRILELSPTQQDLARDVGVSKVTLTHWLRGQRRPTLENLERLVAAIEDRMEAMQYHLDGARVELGVLLDVQSRLQRMPRRRKGK